MGLDAISLMLSKDAPKQAEMTMSPYLKQHIKPGTVGLDMWQNMPLDREHQNTDDTISRGWRMQSLQSCADALLGAAARLEKTVRRETQYWENVLSVSERGWSICRMPREKHNLGVRFGFLEALGEYRDRGLAALRSDESGNVILDKGFGNNSKYVRIRTRLGTKIVGTSKAPRTTADSETTLEASIRAARDSLYEEELFHEMVRESRTLASYGVDMDQSTIYFPTRLDGRAVSAHSKFDGISIDLVSPDETDGTEINDASQDGIAQAIAVALRLLLSYIHRERMKERSEIPQPMSLNRPDTPVAKLLRPVMAVLHHQAVSKTTDLYLERLGTLLRNASIEVKIRPFNFNPASLTTAATMDSLMSGLLNPIRSQSSLLLLGSHTKRMSSFALHIHTSSSMPTLGSEIQIKSALGSAEMDLSETEDLIDYLDAMVANALGGEIAASLAGWTYNESLGIALKPGNGRKVYVVVESGVTGADEGQLTLDTGRERIEWQSGSIEEDKRKRGFWDVVGEIE